MPLTLGMINVNRRGFLTLIDLAARESDPKSAINFWSKEMLVSEYTEYDALGLAELVANGDIAQKS